MRAEVFNHRFRGALLLLLGLGLTGAVQATDVREFIHDTQQTSTTGQQVSSVWWIPPEFWEVSLANNPAVPADTVKQIREAFKDYQVFAVVRAATGVGGFTDMQSKADLIKNVRFEVGGKTVEALAPDQVPPGLQTILGALRPMLNNMLGQLRQSMELIVYPGAIDGQRLIDPLKTGAFDYALYDQAFHWRTPLPSLLPKKIDRKTKEEFPGNYNFNPYTGEKLIAK